MHTICLDPQRQSVIEVLVLGSLFKRTISGQNAKIGFILNRTYPLLE